MKRRILTGLSAVFLATLMAIGAVSAQETKNTGSIRVSSADEAGFTDLAKIPFNSAVQSAVTAVPGKVLKAELENEDGYLVYSIEVAKSDHQIDEIMIDAGNGKVLKIEKDRKDSEDNEKEGCENCREDADES